jgi:hypothetical protein
VLRVEATFFALFMAVFNGGPQSAQVVGGQLYDWLAGLHSPAADLGGLHRGSLDPGPLVKIDRIGAGARRRGAERNSSALRRCTPDNASVPMTGGAQALE